ncbi:uncharacterized protein EAE97_002807 [Botrytis byssoidea]|uniref:Uncharacterized protein n=1 Tax=Botrytis byssoidea TaxID=139641 RepID=A0A9P5IU92_9HELO|nr:uncharacterized protein EAE97_002807 [Botrytis byssoidea]KAF7951256.1 hypothetical protein EAE97_002807 [Botrytis byssoidea]
MTGAGQCASLQSPVFTRLLPGRITRFDWHSFHFISAIRCRSWTQSHGRRRKIFRQQRVHSSHSAWSRILDLANAEVYEVSVTRMATGGRAIGGV